VDRDAIVEGARELLDDARVYAAMASSVNPYGDGRASPRIVDALVRRTHAPR
jgi:UDP-N-acetylglucosamine 2-epimerase (non-hydrolysing)